MFDSLRTCCIYPATRNLNDNPVKDYNLETNMA